MLAARAEKAEAPPVTTLNKIPTALPAPRREPKSAPELLDLVNAALARHPDGKDCVAIGIEPWDDSGCWTIRLSTAPPPARVTRAPNDIVARLNRRYRLAP
jgi:hypothetical protein